MVPDNVQLLRAFEPHACCSHLVNLWHIRQQGQVAVDVSA
jgi:hypothetical protein